MQAFQKPENALKRAGELRAIGKNDEALQVLHSVIGHKSFRVQGWDIVQERIMLQYVSLCVEQRKLRLAKDGLHQYRIVAQHANVLSLGKVITELRDQAENQLKAIKDTLGPEKGIAETLDKVESNVTPFSEDGYSVESPEELMASTLQVEVRDSTTRSLYEAYRFSWETYRMILDIMRSTPKLEKVYHETAHKALNFCLENKRTNEFKKLCELVRNNYAYLLKMKQRPEFESSLRPELHLETRINQLIVASEIGLWREAFNTAEDLYSLGIRDYIMKVFQMPSDYILKQREKLLKWLAIFYEKLAMVFWVSNLDIFHALAWLRYVVHIITFKKSVPETDMENFASKAVLAVLTITLFQQDLDESEYSGDNLSNYQTRRRMASLLGHTNIPTRETLKQGLIIKGIYKYASPKVKELYELVEDSKTPLKLCTKSLPLLEHVANDSYISQYLPKLKEIIFHKLLLQLSKVYLTIKIDYFTSKICPSEFYSWPQAEKVLVDLAYRGLIPMRLDYVTRVIQMKTNDDKRGGSWYRLAKSMLKSVTKLESANLSGPFLPKTDVKAYKESIPHLRALQLERVKMIEKRRMEHQEQLLRDEEARFKQEIEEKLTEERIETMRREEALKQFEMQRKIEKKDKLKSETAQQMLDEIKKIGGGQANKIYIKGKQLDEINVQDVLDGLVDYDDLEKAREEQRIRDRQERNRQRRADAKRADHFIRAIREKETELIEDYKKKVLETDMALIAEAQKRREEKFLVDQAALEDERKCLRAAAEIKNIWISKKMEAMRPQVEKERNEQIKRLVKEIKDAKIARSRLRYLEHQKEMEMEAQRIHQEMDVVNDNHEDRFDIFNDPTVIKESPNFYLADPPFHEAIYTKPGHRTIGGPRNLSKSIGERDMERQDKQKDTGKRAPWRPSISRKFGKSVDEDDDWRRK